MPQTNSTPDPTSKVNALLPDWGQCQKLLERDDVAQIKKHYKGWIKKYSATTLFLNALDYRAPQCVQYLVSKKVHVGVEYPNPAQNPNALFYLVNGPLREPRYLEAKWLATLDVLLQSGIDINQKNQTQKTVLFKIMERGSIEAFDMVWAKDLNPRELFDAETEKSKNIFTLAIGLISQDISGHFLKKIFTRLDNLEDFLKCFNATQEYVERKKTTQPHYVPVIEGVLDKNEYWQEILTQIHVRQEQQFLCAQFDIEPSIEANSQKAKNETSGENNIHPASMATTTPMTNNKATSKLKNKI